MEVQGGDRRADGRPSAYLQSSTDLGGDALIEEVGPAGHESDVTSR